MEIKFNPSQFTKQHYEMLIRAFNNRTRQMNYLELYNRLLSKDISESEFEREIDNNPDKYAIKSGTDKSKEYIFDAFLMSQDFIEPNGQYDIEDLFEIDNYSTYKHFIKDN